MYPTTNKKVKKTNKNPPLQNLSFYRLKVKKYFYSSNKQQTLFKATTKLFIHFSFSFNYPIVDSKGVSKFFFAIYSSAASN